MKPSSGLQDFRNSGWLLQYALIVAVCLSAYLHCLSFSITNSDDDILLTKNLAFLQHLSNLANVFTTDAFYLKKSIDLYRPLQSVTFIIDAQWGGNPIFFAHLTNLVLHTLSCLVVYRLLLLLGIRASFALPGALVYAVHYLFMTAVVWLPARGDLLLGLFGFLSMATFVKTVSSGRRRDFLCHGFFFALAILAKESAVALPVIFAAYLWCYRGTFCLNRCHLLLPIYYLVVLFVYFRLKALSVIVYPGEVGFVSLLKNLRTLPETVAKFYLPLNMSTSPVYKLHSTLVGVVLIIVLASLYGYFRTRFDRRAVFPLVWMLLFILPGMFYYPSFYKFFYEHVDHRAYIPCFGLLLLNLNLVQALDLDRRKGFPVVCLLALLSLTVCNIYLSKSYRNPSEFALSAIRSNPGSAMAYSVYGKELYLQGRDDEALENVNEALRIFNRFSEAHETRALIYRKRGLNREALADLDALIAFEPDYSADVYTLRGQIRIDLHDYEGAARDLETALNLSPEDARAADSLKELELMMQSKYEHR